jgi:hypothetical protein
MLQEYAESSPRQIEATLRKSMEMEIGTDDKSVEDWLKKMNFTKPEAKRIMTGAQEQEGEARTIWQLVQGGTAAARGIAHTDNRVGFERKVSGLLDRVEV